MARNLVKQQDLDGAKKEFLRLKLLKTLDGGKFNDYSVKSIFSSRHSVSSRYSRFEPVKTIQEVKDDGRIQCEACLADIFDF